MPGCTKQQLALLPAWGEPTAQHGDEEPLDHEDQLLPIHQHRNAFAGLVMMGLA